MQKAIFMELFIFFEECSQDSGTIFNEFSEEKIDIQCDHYFQLHHQLKNLKVFVKKGTSTMCPGIGIPTFSLPLL